MGEAAVTFLLEQLKEVVAGYTDLIGGAEREFHELSHHLDLLNAFLKDMAEKKKKDSMFQLLDRRIKDVMYELEDTIDTYLASGIEAQARVKNSLLSANFISKPSSLAKELRSIICEKVHPLFDEAQHFLNFNDECGAMEYPEARPERNNSEGKVRITRRELEVRMRSSVYRRPLEMRLLDKDESWMLLQYEVFGNLEDCPQHLSSIGYEIAIKCKGMPLTIELVGGILADQLKKSPSSAVSEWEKVLGYVSESLGNVVALSYQRLPDDLRECFLFLGVFPEDCTIPAKMLCGLWISERFVLPRNGRSLEESAEENVNYLISRNLLKAQKTNHMGKVKTCRIHDIVREFCISKSKEENLYQEIKHSKFGGFQPAVSEVLNYHRLCVNSNLYKFLSEGPPGAHVRSFFCFYKQPVELEPQYISCIPDCFPRLRILEAECIIFNQFPAKIVKLFHLRYLTLNIETLTILPEAITMLWNLQSLVVETKSCSIIMKANLWRMFQLRCLRTRAAIVLDNNWEGDAGHNLHMLNKLAAESCTEAVSRRAKNLKTLGISGKLANIFESKFLENFNLLEKLKLENRISHGLPQRHCFPPNLKRLTLTNTSLGWKDVSTLALIKSLEVLKLRDNAFVGALWKVDGYNFPDLRLLLMVNINLFQWEASSDAFPRLRFLEVNNCGNLREIPECLGNHLEKLEAYHVRISVVESAIKIAKTEKRRPKGKFDVEFNLTIGAVWKTQFVDIENECNVIFRDKPVK